MRSLAVQSPQPSHPGEEAVRSACAQVRVYGALATLTYVARSGRVPALLAGISNTLRVRPVFKLVDGGDTGRVGLARTTSGTIRRFERAAPRTTSGPGRCGSWSSTRMRRTTPPSR